MYLESLTLKSLTSSIKEMFHINKNLRLFNYSGFELLDDSDLNSLKERKCQMLYQFNHRVLFFTKSN
jgi:hypothetical protein